ncbi:hypothetical protein [Chryseobacterium scophthalmum]|nr:hypothetical protein [Chryseobacterium scophthalmum]
MKKNFLLLFCFISSFVFSQYSFDYRFLVKNSDEKSDNNNYFDTEILINTQNPNYFIYRYKTNEVRLFDYDKGMTIYFLDKSKNNEVLYKYTGRESFIESENKETEIIEIKEVEKDIFAIRTFKSEKEEANLELKIILQKSEKDLLYFYKLDLGNITPQKILNAFRQKLIQLRGNSNYIITSLERNYTNGYNVKGVKLVKYEKINRVIR